MEWIEDEFVSGYRDGWDSDAPVPSANRSEAYRHSFRIARHERDHGKPLMSAEVARAKADDIYLKMSLMDTIRSR